ncbi:MAG TPA: hypothetical protein VJK25_03660 [Patescibacteria group bacterium]|nr:hypothetical protein [Patescibacteria group bacterium]
MRRFFLTIIVLSLFLTGCEIERPKPEIDLTKLNWGLEAQLAKQQAEAIYAEAKNQGLDLSSGPCLSNSLYGNADYPETVWVLDIAHNPRQEVDNQPANQCSAYREGKARNFIELDEAGNVIRIYSPYLKEE